MDSVKMVSLKLLIHYEMSLVKYIVLKALGLLRDGLDKKIMSLKFLVYCEMDSVKMMSLKLLVN